MQSVSAARRIAYCSGAFAIAAFYALCLLGLRIRRAKFKRLSAQNRTPHIIKNV